MEQFRSSWPQPENDPRQNPGQFEHAQESEKDAEKLKKDEKKREEEAAKRKKEAEAKQKPKQENEKQPKKKQETHEKEDAEAEKAKKDRREELVEKSRELREKYEDEPIPRDPAVVAQLLIAEHILSLNNQLENPETLKQASDRDALLASLDYMGELAEKLQDPSKEVSPDIEAASALVLTLAETALADTDPEVLIQQNEAITKQYLEIIAESDKTGAALEIELNNRAKTPVPPLVQHLLTLRRSVAIPAIAKPVASGSDGGAIGSTTSSSISKISKSPSKHTLPAVETRRSQKPDVAASPLAPLAATAAIAASLHREKPQANNEVSPETAPVPPTREDILRAALPFESAPINPPETPEVLPPRATVNKPAEVTLFPATPDQPRLIFPESSPGFISHEASPAEPAPTREPAKPKLEHLPLTTLLTMAETVSIGYGRYLRREFEAGHIDKEGLIKVLKSRAKGKDFQVEFQNQAVRFQTLKATSPEFLASTPPPPAPPLPSEPLTTAFTAPPTPPKPTEPTRSTLPRPVPQTTESKVANEQPSTDLQQKLDQVSNKTWIAAIALASVILLLLVLSLMR